MNILVLGGTGAIGKSLVEYLQESGNQILVTSRKSHKNYGNVSFICGDAKNISFLRQILAAHYDVIIDFMVYSTNEFSERYQLLLQNTDKYIFISSCRVFDIIQIPITENSPKLLDRKDDPVFLNTDEYSLSKARQENILKTGNFANWTIVRPYITYNDNRLQLGVYEKENWLYRALHGRSIVFSKDILNRFTTLSYGGDAGKAIACIAVAPNTTSQSFNIVGNTPVKWSEVLDIYLDAFEEIVGFRPKVFCSDLSTNLQLDSAKYQVIYCRASDRIFDNSKLMAFCNFDSWTDVKYGIHKCMASFLSEKRFNNINWEKEALIDKTVSEWTPLSEIPGSKNKLLYLIFRLGFEKPFLKISKFKKQLKNRTLKDPKRKDL